jgi:GPI-anchor transamidase subunit S
MALGDEITDRSHDGQDDAQEVADGASLRSTGSQSKMASKLRRQPPPEAKEAVWLRSKVIFSFWAVIVFLGLPMWWQTTSIYRARLPHQEMLDWSEGSV